MMGWYGGGGMGGFGWLAMGGFWIILLGLIVWLVIRLLPASKDDQPSRFNGESAVEVLDRRMANGEIDTQTWQAQRSALLSAQREGK